MLEINKMYEDTIDKLKEFADQKGDEFSIKIYRRNSVSDILPSSWCTLEGAQLRHITDRELWIGDLIGNGKGGVFDMAIFHAEQPHKPIGMQIRVVKQGDAGEPNIAVALSPGWKGPARIVFPDPSKMQPVVTPATSLPQNTVAPATAAASEAKTALATSGLAGADAATQKAVERANAALAEVEKQRAALAEERAAIERERMESRHKEELRAMEARFALMEARLTQAAQPAPAQPKVDLLDKLPALIAAFAPIITPVLQRADDRHREQMAAIRESGEKQMQLVEKLMSQKNDAGDMYKKVSEAVMSLAGTSVQMMHKVAELQPGEPPVPGWVPAVESISTAIENIAKAVITKQSVSMNVQQRPQLPAARQATAQNTNDVVSIIEAKIRAMEDPKLIVELFFNSLENPAMQAALSGANGDPVELYKSRLGTWIIEKPEHTTYVQALAEALQEGAKSRGFVPEEEEEDEKPSSDTNGATAPAATTAAPAQA